jgi:hypothetical protein
LSNLFFFFFFWRRGDFAKRGLDGRSQAGFLQQLAPPAPAVRRAGGRSPPGRGLGAAVAAGAGRPAGGDDAPCAREHAGGRGDLVAGRRALDAGLPPWAASMGKK